MNAACYYQTHGSCVGVEFWHIDIHRLRRGHGPRKVEVTEEVCLGSGEERKVALLRYKGGSGVLLVADCYTDRDEVHKAAIGLIKRENARLSRSYHSSLHTLDQAREATSKLCGPTIPSPT